MITIIQITLHVYISCAIIVFHLSRGGVTVTRKAHNLEIPGAIPGPATSQQKDRPKGRFFCCCGCEGSTQTALRAAGIASRSMPRASSGYEAGSRLCERDGASKSCDRFPAPQSRKMKNSPFKGTVFHHGIGCKISLFVGLVLISSLLVCDSDVRYMQ